MKFRVVNTDNYGSDYPDESFVGEVFGTRWEAQRLADGLNNYQYATRYYKVVREGYILQPGFEP